MSKKNKISSKVNVIPSKSIGVTRTGQLVNLSQGSSKSVKFSQRNDAEDRTVISKVNVKNDQIEIAKWGKNNVLPQRREEMICDNNIVGQLIATKRELTLGQGLYAYKEVIEKGKVKREQVLMPDETLEWLEQVEWDDYIEHAGNELYMHKNVFTEFIKGEHVDRIVGMSLKPCKNIRAQKQSEKGIIDNYFYSGSWGKNQRKNSAIKIPSFIPNTQSLQTKSILHTGDRLFYDGYYCSPAYWGGKEWIDTSNKIPKFHQSNLENSYNIKYHIQIPADYFLDTEKFATADDKQKILLISEAESAEEIFINDLNKFLGGAKNVGKALITKYEIYKAYDFEKVYPGIKIEAIKGDNQGDSLLKLFDKSNEANISAQGIHPILASIQTQGKLSSGSDIRNALLLYLATKAPLPRRILLKPLNYVKRINNWDTSIKFGFQDSLITKLDDNPNGIESTTEAA